MTRLLGLLALVASLGVACGDSATSSSTTAAPSSTTSPTTTLVTTTTAPAAFPVTVETEAGVATLSERPERIAALSAPLVEILFAIGAGDQIAAVDVFSDYPAEAADLPQVDSFALNLESVAALDPDLVILSFDPGQAVDGLNALDIPVMLLGTPATLSDAYDQFEVLGLATGRSEEAAAAVAAIERGVDAAVTRVGETADGWTVYHETDQFSFYTPNSASFIGHLYALVGMENIADAAPDEFGSGFPQLSPEYIIASDPDIVFLASFGETPQTFAARPGWDTMSAVADGAVFPLDTDIASRWGPRVVDLMDAIATAIEAHAGG
ncbi:MAG: ABC transporter substrate-binding protein [Acidimicrobiia bacterium]|nr:ABC transporter substrate-binding protein [Acidimicrobiia bacterium]